MARNKKEDEIHLVALKSIMIRGSDDYSVSLNKPLCDYIIIYTLFLLLRLIPSRNDRLISEERK